MSGPPAALLVALLLVVVAALALRVAWLQRALNRQSADADVAREQLREQTAELELQVEEAQSLARELEHTNADLSSALATVETSEERLRCMFTESPLPKFVYDLETLAFLDVNAAAIAAYGHSRDDFLAMTIRAIRPPEDVPRLENLVRTQALVGGVVRGSSRHLTKDGALRDVELTAQDTLFDGRPARLVVAFDVTERSRISDREHFLAESSNALGGSLAAEAALARVAELSVVRIAAWCAVDLLDANGALRQVAIACAPIPERERWATWTRERGARHPIAHDAPGGPAAVVRDGKTVYHTLLTRALADTLWPAAGEHDDDDDGPAALERRSLIVAPLTAHGRVLGTITLLSSTDRRFTDADCAVTEEIARHAGLSIDNTTRYVMEQSLRRAAEAAADRTARLQAVTAALGATLTPAAVARVIVHHGIEALGGAAGTVATLDERTQELVVLDTAGYAEAQVTPYRRMAMDTPLPLTDAVRTGEAVILDSWEMRHARYPALYAVRRAESDGPIAAVPLIVDGRRVGAFGISFPPGAALEEGERRFLFAIAQQCAQAVDRARLYEAEEVARASAEAANRAKSDFLATMSHELRTPLNAIAGFAQLLEDGLYGQLSADQLAVIARIDRAQRHLLGLINDVLNYAKLEAGKVQYHVEETRLADVVAEATALGETQLAGKQITLNVLPCPADEAGVPLTVWADRDKLRQVLLNLLSNAGKFTPAGGRVAVECLLARDDQTDRAIVRVSDTGIGIPPEKLEAVFEPFVQVDNSRTREQQGTGLGLAISRDLARGMGGDLSVTSEPGKGSTFTLDLHRVVTARGERTERRNRDDRRAGERRRRTDRRGD